MNYDYHIHTQYSFDSIMKGEDLLRKAIELGYDEIAITEHLDLLPGELSVHGLPSLAKYQEYCRKLQEKHPEIVLRMGVEIGDYHLVRDFAKALITGFDFFPILGSVHFLSDQINVAIPLKKPLSKAQIKDYYMQNLRLVEECDIDVLGHLGVYKRYYEKRPDEGHVQGLIKDIFRVMIEREIALEINLSSLEKAYREILPELDYIRLYQDMGGSLFSLGSDAHVLKSFGSTLGMAEKLGISAQPPRRRRSFD